MTVERAEALIRIEDERDRLTPLLRSGRTLGLFLTVAAAMFGAWGAIGQGPSAWILFAAVSVLAALTWGRYWRRSGRTAALEAERERLLDPPRAGSGVPSAGEASPPTDA